VTHVPIYRRDFKTLPASRSAEVRIVPAKGKQQGAYYLAGYTVEGALKACIAKKTKRFEFPAKAEYIRKLYAHELDKLLSLAGLDAQLNKDMAANKVFEANWSTGAIPSVRLRDGEKLRSFLEKRLGISPYEVNQALNQLIQKGSTSIFTVQVNLRKARKLNLAV
jgi:hypothetical protein